MAEGVEVGVAVGVVVVVVRAANQNLPDSPAIVCDQRLYSFDNRARFFDICIPGSLPVVRCSHKRHKKAYYVILLVRYTTSAAIR